MMKKILLLLILVGSTFNSFAVQLKVNVQNYYNSLAGMYSQHVYITSMENSVAIKGVTINKGNCRIGTSPREYRVTLKYGQRVRVTPIIGCSVLEVKVVTNKGTKTYSFK
ncbi:MULTISPECIES: hypothetical protein [unclassified Gilliamella]|uniref:hypothetical protein n=1 Tax=unclassified Gilliamella TaxID=2685620 RepID=UPI00080DE8FD|nr:hypothetical protein [Gilliamella apicola]OCG34215.1 hypothetical protein A9G32_09895 [Gilliamella apicola]OCG48713.1 hypothetical protein A9G27_04110 [Gilliamella apicola]OCG52568.1 hypothetical protein A9G26_02440 [Gilliamella apicola]